MKKAVRIKVRQAILKDINDMLMVEEEAWQGKFQFTREHLISQMETYPEGLICALVDGKVEGFVVLEILNYEIGEKSPSWSEITDNGFIKNTHNDEGDTIYGVNLSVSPHAMHGTSDMLMEAVAKLTIKRNMKQVILGGRIPRYHKYCNKYTPEEYIRAKKGKRLLDPELYIYNKAGLEIIKVIPNYFNDPESLNNGVLLRWKNPSYNWFYPLRWLLSRLFKL